MTPFAKLIFDALTFAELAAGEGMGLLSDPENNTYLFPEDFLMEYSKATDDDQWETLARRVAERIEYLEDMTWRYEEASK